VNPLFLHNELFQPQAAGYKVGFFYGNPKKYSIHIRDFIFFRIECRDSKKEIKTIVFFGVFDMCQNCCQQPNKLQDKPENCSPQQINKCHGDVTEHPCTKEKPDSGQK